MNSRPLIVVADDDPTIRRLLEITVKNTGCDVVGAADGEQALRLIRELRPRLAILDVSMPFRSGLEVGKALRGNGHTAIMFLTSHAQEQDVLEGFLSGASDYLSKPFSPKELQARLRAVLART